MSKRQALGPVDFLDVAIGQAPPPAASAAPRATSLTPARRREAPRATTAPKSKTRTALPERQNTRVTFHLPPELVDEARNAVVALSGPPVRLTLAGLVRDALRRELDRLNKEHHAGKPWPRRAGELVGGRPIGS
jgi:hypothetical protein